MDTVDAKVEEFLAEGRFRRRLLIPTALILFVGGFFISDDAKWLFWGLAGFFLFIAAAHTWMDYRLWKAWKNRS